MRKSKNVFTNSILYTIGNLMLKAFSFFLIPLYTSYLTTEAYGVINLATGFFSVASSLLILSLNYALVRFYADYKDDKDMVARMIGSVMSFIALICLIFVAISVLFRDIVSNIFFNGISFWPVVFLSVIIAVFSGFYTLYQEILKGMQEATRSVILSYIYFFLLLFCNVVTVVKLEMGEVGVLFSNLFVNFIMVVFLFVDLYRRSLIKINLDFRILASCLKYSLPLLPHTMAYNLSSYVTKILIAEKLSLALLGLYSLASQFGGIADVVLNSVQAAFQPWMFGVLKKNDTEENRKLVRNTYVLMWLYGFIFLGIACYSQEIVFIIAEKSYAGAWFYIPVVVIAVALKTPLYFYQSFMYYDKDKTKYVFVSTLVFCVVNVLLTWLLIPHLQIYGSILADVLAMIARLYITMRVLPKDIKAMYSLRKMTFYSIIPVLFIIIAMLPSYLVFSEELSLINFGYKTLIILIYFVIALYINRRSVVPIMKNVMESIRRRG